MQNTVKATNIFIIMQRQKETEIIFGGIKVDNFPKLTYIK